MSVRRRQFSLRKGRYFATTSAPHCHYNNRPSTLSPLYSTRPHFEGNDGLDQSSSCLPIAVCHITSHGLATAYFSPYRPNICIIHANAIFISCWPYKAFKTWISIVVLINLNRELNFRICSSLIPPLCLTSAYDKGVTQPQVYIAVLM